MCHVTFAASQSHVSQDVNILAFRLGSTYLIHERYSVEWLPRSNAGLPHTNFKVRIKKS